MQTIYQVALVLALVVLGQNTTGATQEIQETLDNVPSKKRVLFLAPISPRSHYSFYASLTDALADHGLQVTLVSDHTGTPRPNVRRVLVRDINMQTYYRNMFQDGQKALMNLSMSLPELCTKALVQPQVQSLLGESFDLVLLASTFSDCFLSIVHQLQLPFVYVLPLELIGMVNNYMGNPAFQSVTGSMLMPYQHPLTFTQRLKTALYDNIGYPLNWYLQARIQELCKEKHVCPPDMPSLLDLHYNASLLIENSVRSLQYPARPLVPSIIAAGGIHIRPPKPLPQDLEEWVQGAGEEGFIFFSLGSAIRPSEMPEKYRRLLVRVFGSLKQRVLWKWDQDDMDDLPHNVRIQKWLPQQDILGHQSLRLFMTHGGLLSTQEATYNGVALLGLPVFLDQHNNMRKAELQGWGRTVLWEDLTDESLLKVIQEIIADKRLNSEAKRRSRVMRDVPMAPGDEVAYWVHYLIRHGGAPHLRSPITSMAWYEVYNVDVWLAVVGVVVAVAWVVLKACARLITTRVKHHKQE